MVPSSSAPSGIRAARPGGAIGKQATTPSLSRLPRRRFTLTCLELPAVTALTLALLILAAALPRPALAAPGAWSPTAGSMSIGRTRLTATLLPSGQVLVAGGVNPDIAGQGLDSWYLYDPGTGNFWSFSHDRMVSPRVDHTATLLPSGLVLVAGGSKDNITSGSLASAELYDSSAWPRWRATASMGATRMGHSATLLSNGLVLVAGGLDNSATCLASAEVYDPAGGTWSSAGPNMGEKRWQHTATLLPDGRVLVAGGNKQFSSGQLAGAEIYDPIAHTWTATPPMVTPRFGHTATLLPSGVVLVAGGDDGTSRIDTAEVYDPAANKWTATGSLAAKRMDHTATPLLNGQVLVAGGFGNTYAAVGGAELYSSGTWAATGSLGTPRGGHRAVRLANGRVLAVGGWNAGPLATAELYEPAPPPQVNLPSPLAFFPFEGNALDVSGHGCNGSITGSPALVSGYQGQAYSFNGSTDYITVPLDINPVKYPRLTMGCWAKTISGWPAQQLLTQDNGDFDRSLGIDFRGNGIGWSAFCGTGGVLGAVPAILGQWTFVAVTYDQDKGTVKLQVEDMVLTKTGVALGPGQSQLFIGTSPAFPWTYFSGLIDNVFIFGEALTDQQLAYIRSRGARAFTKPNPGLLLLLMN
jgi:hypothetical protein